MGKDKKKNKRKNGNGTPYTLLGEPGGSRLETEARGSSTAAEDSVDDDRLRLIFTCCHPALTPDAMARTPHKELAEVMRLIGPQPDERIDRFRGRLQIKRGLGAGEHAKPGGLVPPVVEKRLAERFRRPPAA